MQEQRERDDLLHSVRQEIGEYKSAASARADPLLRERNAANSSLRTADNIMSQAQVALSPP